MHWHVHGPHAACSPRPDGTSRTGRYTPWATPPSHILPPTLARPLPRLRPALQTPSARGSGVAAPHPAAPRPGTRTRRMRSWWRSRRQPLPRTCAAAAQRLGARAHLRRMALPTLVMLGAAAGLATIATGARCCMRVSGVALLFNIWALHASLACDHASLPSGRDCALLNACRCPHSHARLARHEPWSSHSACGTASSADGGSKASGGS